MKTALATNEVGLRGAVPSVDKPADGASLARVPGVYRNDLAAESLSFVLKKALELGETPGVKSAFGFATRGFNARPDISEVLNHDSGAGFNAVEDRSRENVVAIPSEALFTPSEASKVSLGTLRAVGLQVTSKTKDTLHNFLRVPVAVEAVIGCHGRPGDTEVNTDSLPGRYERHVGQFDNDMQVEDSLAVHQVGGDSGGAASIVGIFRERERYVLPPGSGSKIDGVRFPIHLECMKVVTWRTISRLRTGNLKPLLRLGYSRLNRLRSLLASLNMQVRDKSRISLFAVSVSQTMQSIGIAFPLLPAYLTDRIKRVRELANRIPQGFSLLITRIKSNLYRSIHTGIIPYDLQDMQINLIRKEVWRIPLPDKSGSPLRQRLWETYS